MRNLLALTIVLLLMFVTACKRNDSSESRQPGGSKEAVSDDHDHGPGSDHQHDDHGDPGHDHAASDDGEDHEHDEVALGVITVGDMQVKIAQAHGTVEPGQESHLVVKLPYDDQGATIVRAWIGTEDRTMSFVGKGEYAAAHDDYDIHALAPDPLPDDVMWWIEIAKPDGTKFVGSIRPLLE